MALTLKDAATFLPDAMQQSLLHELYEEHPWYQDILEQGRREWAAKPWQERARIRAKNWIIAHTPHIHVYLGQHPEEDW